MIQQSLERKLPRYLDCKGLFIDGGSLDVRWRSGCPLAQRCDVYRQTQPAMGMQLL